jgi:hypothetical protein
MANDPNDSPYRVDRERVVPIAHGPISTGKQSNRERPIRACHPNPIDPAPYRQATGRIGHVAQGTVGSTDHVVCVSINGGIGHGHFVRCQHIAHNDKALQIKQIALVFGHFKWILWKQRLHGSEGIVGHGLCVSWGCCRDHPARCGSRRRESIRRRRRRRL